MPINVRILEMWYQFGHFYCFQCILEKWETSLSFPFIAPFLVSTDSCRKNLSLQLLNAPLCAPAGHQLWTISAIWCGPKTNNKKKKQLAKSCLKAPRRSQKWSSGWELSVGLSEHVTTFTLHIIWGLRSFVVLQRSTIIQVTISPFICSLRFSAPSGHFDDRLNRVIIVGNNCSAGEDEMKLE